MKDPTKTNKRRRRHFAGNKDESLMSEWVTDESEMSADAHCFSLVEPSSFRIIMYNTILFKANNYSEYSITP